MTAPLLSKLSRARRKEQSIGAAMALTLASAYLVAVFAISMFADWLIELPYWVRAALLVIDVGVVIWLAIRFAFWLLIFPADDDTLALAVERHEPRFEGRLICSVQLSREGAIPAGASRSLVSVMIREAVEIAHHVDFTAAIRAEALARRFLGTLLLLLLAGVLMLAYRPISVPLLLRAVLMNVSVPRKTQVIPVSTDKVIAVGDDFIIEAMAGGVKPQSGKVRLQYKSGTDQEAIITHDPNNAAHFLLTVNNIQEQLRYTVYLGDNHGETYTVTTTPRPMVTGLQCWQVFPAYTHLQPTRRQMGDLGKLLRGSRLILSINASKPLKATTDAPVNRIHLSGAELPDIALRTNPTLDLTYDHKPADAATDLDGITLPDKTNGLSIFLVDENGVQSKDPAVYPINLVDKNKPIIKLLSPKDAELLGLPGDTLPMSFTAHDDFAIGGLSLHYKTESDGKEYTVPLPLDGTPTDANAAFDWAMSTIQIPPGGKLEGTICDCWLRVTDTDDVSNPDHQPNFGDSDHFQLRITTQEEIDAHLHELQHEAMGTIGTITEEQQQTNDDFNHNLLKSSTQPTEQK
jgi:hypothetical protein